MSGQGGTPPRAAIFFYDGYISISASVLSAAQELRARGYAVDIFYNKPPMDVPTPALPAGITLHEHVPWTRWLLGPILERLRRNRLRKLSQTQADNETRQKSARLRMLVKAFIAFVEMPQFALYCRRHAGRSRCWRFHDNYFSWLQLPLW